ncbi:MAG: hypothetical protein OXI41_14260 [Chloroflexota bacterium]|nr:hypothetical protein [Chloroflexota bacterium]
MEFHYDDSWNLYVLADGYKDSPGITSARERAEWRRVADFVDDCVIPRPSDYLRD